MTYALVLNDMRSPNVENVQIVALADDPAELRALYEREAATHNYVDGQWAKSFRKDGPLEWFNPVHDLATLNDFWGGIWEVGPSMRVGDALVKGGAL